jgi:hypothetical protein
MHLVTVANISRLTRLVAAELGRRRHVAGLLLCVEMPFFLVAVQAGFCHGSSRLRHAASCNWLNELDQWYADPVISWCADFAQQVLALGLPSAQSQRTHTHTDTHTHTHTHTHTRTRTRTRTHTSNVSFLVVVLSVQPPHQPHARK